MKRLSILLLCLSFICSSLAQEQSDAQFPGGEKALMQFLRETVCYPNRISSQKDFNVVVEVLIQEDGTAVFGKMKSPSNASDNIVREVKRVIKTMPTWEPAASVQPDGRIVAEKSVVELTIPFSRQYTIGVGCTEIHVEKAGTLAQLLTQTQKDTCKSLLVSGPINSKDILTLRRMAGGDGGKGHLERINLSHAKIVTDKETPYLALDVIKDRVMLYTREQDSGRDKRLQYDNHYHYNETTPYIRERSDNAAPTYNVIHSSGWKGTRQNELRYMEEANPWFAVIALTQVSPQQNQRLQSKISGATAQDSFRLTRIRRKAMRKLKGQEIVEENGSYIYKSYTRKNNFCLDMFYNCLELKTVVLPNGIQPNNHVYVVGSHISYY